MEPEINVSSLKQSPGGERATRPYNRSCKHNCCRDTNVWPAVAITVALDVREMYEGLIFRILRRNLACASDVRQVTLEADATAYAK